jgi:ABC-type Fe3+/spermidine/putrescine transport system ATPase subunit
VLLLDEPLSALDAKVREDLRGDQGPAVRAVHHHHHGDHDQHEAMEVADRIVVMNAGRCRRWSSGAELYDRPANTFVAEFLGRMNCVPSALVRVAAATGEVTSACGPSMRRSSRRTSFAGCAHRRRRTLRVPGKLHG